MEQNTVFIIGAGASKEVNLPVGSELKTQISDLLDIRFDYSEQKRGDRLITKALRELVKNDTLASNNINPYLHEAWHIRDALPLAISIDNFIDSQRGNKKIEICGKLGIVRSILEAEKHSLLYFDEHANIYERGFEYSVLENTWYLPFFRLLTENCEKKQLADRFSYVSLIIFNYDRCFEHFIFNALQNYYRLSSEEAAKIGNSLNIYHPYGCVGPLPWQSLSKGIPYGGIVSPEQLLDLSRKVRTFTEGSNSEVTESIELKNKLITANRVAFLGFAFHPLNMQLIAPEDYYKNHQAPLCYATTLGISESDKRVIQSQVNTMFGNETHMETANLKCSDFFSEFWRSLSFQ